MVNHVYADLFNGGSVHKQLNIVSDDGMIIITNEELHQGKFTLEESLCSTANLKLGSCEASVVKFTVSNVFTSMKDKWLTITMILDHDTANPVPIGRYKVYSDVPTADRSKRDITAYDAMYDIINTNVADWYNTILPKKSSKVTLKQFRDSFFNNFPVSQEDSVLPNDDLIVERTIEPEEISGKDVITAICEINGCFGNVNREGKFRYVFLTPAEEGLYPSLNLYPSEDLFPKAVSGLTISTSMYVPPLEYEDYITDTITGVQIRQEENDIGATVGAVSNAYVIQDNFLVYGKGSDELTTIAQRILNVIRQIIFRPFKVKAKGNPCIEVGDTVRISSSTMIVYSYILQRTLSGIQALMDNFETKSSKSQEVAANSVNRSIIQLKAKTNTLTRTVEQTKSELKDLENKTTTAITQTSNQIELLAERTSDTESSISTLKITSDGLVSDVSETKRDLNDLSGTVSQHSSRIAQTPTSIYLGVNNDETKMTSSITISLKDENGNTVGDELTETIELKGVVTFSDLSEENTKTKINGANILSGTITADMLNLTGTDAPALVANGILIENMIYAHNDDDSAYIIGDNMETHGLSCYGHIYTETLNVSDSANVGGNLAVEGTLSASVGTFREIYMDDSLLDVIISDLEDRIAAIEAKVK